MKHMQLEGRWVLVTGASSGLGREMARALAREHRANVILVARRRQRLDELRQELESQVHVQARVIQADLSNPQDVDRVFHESTKDVRVDAVILNAGVTYFGPHRDLEWPEYEALIATNVTSVVRLTNLFAPYLIEQSQAGGIMLVTSMAAFLPAPYQTVYSGAKAFITHFGQCFAEELHGQNVSLTVFVPGGIATEMTQTSGLSAKFEGSMHLQRADACAREGLAALVARKKLAVSGFLNRAQLFASRFMPRRLIMTIARVTFENALSARARALQALPNPQSEPAPRALE